MMVLKHCVGKLKVADLSRRGKARTYDVLPRGKKSDSGCGQRRWEGEVGAEKA